MLEVIDDGNTSGRAILVLDLCDLCRMNQNVTKKILKIITRATECCVVLVEVMDTTVNKLCRQDLPTPHGMYN